MTTANLVDTTPRGKPFGRRRGRHPLAWGNIGPHAHPIVRELCAAALSQNIRLEDLAKRSGIGRAALRNWRHGRTQPTVAMLDAALQALGLRLAVTEVFR